MNDYERGQYDMRKRVERQWRGWSTNTITGMEKAKKGIGNVPAMIRARNPVRPAPAKPSPKDQGSPLADER